MTLLSPDKKTIILHVPRTGGTGRRAALRKKGYRVLREGSFHCRLHDLWRVHDICPETAERVVIFVRDPAQRELSMWNWAREQGFSGDQMKFPRMHDDPNGYLSDPRCGPAQWYERYFRQGYYNHDTEVTYDEHVNKHGYHYWCRFDGEPVMGNVDVVWLECQDAYLSKLIGESVEVPMLNGA